MCTSQDCSIKENNLIRVWNFLAFLLKQNPQDNPDLSVFYLLVRLQFAAHHSEGSCCWVVINLDTAEVRNIGSDRHPAFVAVIVHHYRSFHLTNAGLTAGNNT